MATSYGWGSNEPTISPASQGGDSVHTFATKVKTVVADIMTKLNAEWWNTGGSGGVSITGNAATATKLATARTIALSDGATGTATSFDGSANIEIPVTSLDASKLSGTASVSTTGNAATATTASSCSGNAATATKLATARTIALSGGATGTATSFDGSANIEIPVTSLDASKLSGTASISTTGNAATATTAASCSGNAATATTATTATTASSCSGNAATATKLATARSICGTLFDGSADVVLGDVPRLPNSSRQSCSMAYHFTVPAGGTWFVWAIAANNSGVQTGPVMYHVQGGTALSLDSTQVRTCWFAWKVTD